MHRRWQGIAVGAVVTMGVVGMAPAAAVGGSAGPANVQFRPVLATLPPSTASATTPPTNDGGVVESCDPAAVTAESVTTTVHNRADRCVVLELGAPGEGDRLYLGPVALDGSDVRRAASVGNAGEDVIALTLTRSGQRAMNRLAADGYPKEPPGNQMAIVVDGRVVAAPAFQEPNFRDGVQVSATFTPAKAKALARRIGASQWLSRFLLVGDERGH